MYPAMIYFQLGTGRGCYIQTRKPRSFWELPEGITWSSGGSGGKGLLWNAQINSKRYVAMSPRFSRGSWMGSCYVSCVGSTLSQLSNLSIKGSSKEPILGHFRLPFREQIFRPQKAMPNCACCTARTIRHHRQIKMKPWGNLPSLPSGKLT